jgi:hypothetical protein
MSLPLRGGMPHLNDGLCLSSSGDRPWRGDGCGDPY